MKTEEKAIGCVYRSLWEACRATKRQWESAREGRRLHILPYNRFKPDESRIWWLSPSSVNPAYRHGKFAFLTGRDGTMEVGLYVEKGLGKDYCLVNNTKSALTMVMEPGWTWHDVIRDMANGQIGAALDEVSRRSEIAVEVFVTGGYASPGFNPEDPRYQWDRFVFRLSERGGMLTPLETSHAGNVLSELEGCDSLTSLAHELSGFTTNGFVWIDLWFAVRLRLGMNGGQAWNAGRIAWNVLYPLEDWVK